MPLPLAASCGQGQRCERQKMCPAHAPSPCLNLLFATRLPQPHTTPRPARRQQHQPAIRCNSRRLIIADACMCCGVADYIYTIDVHAWVSWAWSWAGALSPTAWAGMASPKVVAAGGQACHRHWLAWCGMLAAASAELQLSIPDPFGVEVSCCTAQFHCRGYR
jgi:hypothetical protein